MSELTVKIIAAVAIAVGGPIIIYLVAKFSHDRQAEQDRLQEQRREELSAGWYETEMAWELFALKLEAMEAARAIMRLNRQP